MIQETTLKNDQRDDLMFHFVPEIVENTYNNVNKDVRDYVNHFLVKLCMDYDGEPKSIGLVGDIKTLSIIIGRLVQDYEMYKDLNEEFSPI
jgi:hypothetical protein